jgi:uncharacterized protein YkuJ
MSIIDGLKLDELQERNSNDKANIVTPGEKICEVPNSPALHRANAALGRL